MSSIIKIIIVLIMIIIVIINDDDDNSDCLWIRIERQQVYLNSQFISFSILSLVPAKNDRIIGVWIGTFRM